LEEDEEDDILAAALSPVLARFSLSFKSVLIDLSRFLFLSISGTGMLAPVIPVGPAGEGFSSSWLDPGFGRVI
jgi:hypothetical protein